MFGSGRRDDGAGAGDPANPQDAETQVPATATQEQDCMTAWCNPEALVGSGVVEIPQDPQLAVVATTVEVAGDSLPEAFADSMSWFCGCGQ